MKITVVILLLVAAAYATEPPYRGRHKARDTLNEEEKRELEEGASSTNVDKRAPVLSTVAPSPTPGIEYADAKETQQDKSPAQQVYATPPAPPIAKISDVLTGQGPPFQAAIANHLYSPISAYQPRLGAPAYDISPPVPAPLAYAEHRVQPYPPQPNAVPVAQPAQPVKELPANYQPAYQQQIIVPQPYPQHLAHPQQLLPQFQQIVPQNYQVYRPVQYIQTPPIAHPASAAGLAYLKNQIQLPYLQAPQPLIPVPVQIPSLQPGLIYPQDAHNGHQNVQIIPRAQPPPPQPIVVKEQGAQHQHQHQKPSVQVLQPQGAVSYASFSQSQPLQPIQLKQQPHQLLQQPRITLQFRAQPLNTQVKAEGQENLDAASSRGLRPISYFRPGVSLVPVHPQQQLLVPNPGYSAQAFAPVQYFGKHAQSIFARYGPQP